MNMTPSSRPTVLVIGAGYAGMAALRALLERGVSVEAVEKDDGVGGNWYRGIYRSVHIISSRDTTGYAEFPMPADYPDFPSRDQMLAYLNSYADTFDLRSHIRFNTCVAAVTPLDPSGMSGWRVRFADGTERNYAAVVVANGHHWDKRVPSYPGAFTGRAVHSRDYVDEGDLAGERVLVVGAGNSGCDIAVEAARAGYRTSISIRTGRHFLPKTLFGIPVAEMDSRWPLWAQRALLSVLLRIVVGKNSRYGLAEPEHELFERHPTVNSDLLHYLRHGRIDPRPGIDRFDGKTVHFVDGSSQDADTIVWATGYNISFPFLDSDLFAWQNGVPARVGSIFAPGRANLYVFGLLQPRGGAGPLLSAGAELIADAVAAQPHFDVPLADVLAPAFPAQTRMLVGVVETQRAVERMRRAIRRHVKRAQRSLGLVPVAQWVS